MQHQTLDFPHDESQEVRVDADALKQLAVDLLVDKTLFRFDAETAADRLVEADLRGIQSHGTRALPRYLDAIDAGDIDPRAKVLTESETPAVAVLDGGLGIGHVAATRGMQMAIAKAREVGTGTVAVKGSRHYGAASVYALMAAREGLIAYCTTSTGGATVAAYGSRGPAVANNAFAWAVPSREGPPFVLDMACGATSWGKVESFKLYGTPLPDGMALDAEGHPTTDAAAARTMLPSAGARGFGLAFLSSVLAGPLIGGKMPLHKTGGPLAERSEHFFYVLDVKQFGDEERFYRELDATMAEIRALPPAAGFDRVRFPGELEAEREEEYRRSGIPLHRDHAALLEQRAAPAALTVPWS
ncbi:MAG: Ldh family oxidoreductase [Planctomycetota bacterium]|nr:MAG: Ldh family oxidoreductase [Planctomycetota bacterium]REJ95522.1 MAG: Ldh family oxidoreductase [Planctomycetota bacterium]REK21908.1 MAG: Ldh family oxidoreductase [Planctomycetota bacterium]REK32180.1 MAG: Ldh family oxidoreductase [Planctomycetota bacterium]